MPLKLSDFDYELPKELIAQYPLKERDSARLLVVDRKKNSLVDSIFSEIPGYFARGDMVVLNDTRVKPCRLAGSRLTGGKVEALLLKKKDGLTFEALIKPAKIKLNEKIIFDPGRVWAVLSSLNELTFSAAGVDEIYALGVMPLPPYIKRPVLPEDEFDYQTVYAANDGSVASPTAGLHFTRELMEGIRSKGINIGFVTLHVGYATFKPVKAEAVTDHKMGAESFDVPLETRRLIEKTRGEGSRIIAVGTTSARTLETFAGGRAQGDTNLFIYPGYEFKLVDALLTNFHLPKTTLFMLVCAFAGEELAKKAYSHAVKEKYRFYSYGDAMLII